MEEPIFYLGSLNSNDLPRHFISMEEDTLLVCRKSKLVCVNPEQGLILTFYDYTGGFERVLIYLPYGVIISRANISKLAQTSFKLSRIRKTDKIECSRVFIW